MLGGCSVLKGRGIRRSRPCQYSGNRLLGDAGHLYAPVVAQDERSFCVNTPTKLAGDPVDSVGNGTLPPPSKGVATQSSGHIGEPPQGSVVGIGESAIQNCPSPTRDGYL